MKKQLAFAFHDDPKPRVPSPAEEQFLFGCVRLGWLGHRPANDNGDSPMFWRNPKFPRIDLFRELSLEYLLGLQHTADFCFRSQGRSLVVEIDGDRWHSTPARMASDKRIDRAIQSTADGWAIHRYPAREVLDPRLCEQTMRSVHHHLRWMMRTKAPERRSRATG